MKKYIITALFIASAGFAHAQSATAKHEGTASQFGKSYAQGMAGVTSYSDPTPNYSTEYCVTASLEFAFNVYRNESDTCGLNLSVPLEYYWTAGHVDGIRGDRNSFYFPLFAQPYYRVRVSDNFEITPFVSAGAGGIYAHDTLGNGGHNTLDFYWGAGGGVEFLMFRDFAFTPKYEFSRIESGTAYEQHTVSAQFAWKFTRKTALIAEYRHIFMENSHVCEDIGRLGVRFEF